jgi:hypothetical protein
MRLNDMRGKQITSGQAAKGGAPTPAAEDLQVSRRAFVACGAFTGALGLLGCGTPRRDDASSSPGAAAQGGAPAAGARDTPAAPAEPPPESAPPEAEHPAQGRRAESDPLGLPPAVDAWLTANAVLSQRPHATTLRTWTSPAQGRELVRGAVLTRSHGEDLSQSFFDQILARRRSHDPVAALLSGSAWRRSRYAWPHAWPIARGLHGARYGSVLATLRLRADVLWLGYATTSPDTWTLHDTSGTALTGVDPRDVSARIAGVFFEASPLASDAYRARNATLPAWGPWGMREYIVRNPASIESVSVDAPDELAVHQRDLTRLAELATWVGDERQPPPRFGELAAAVWAGPPTRHEAWRTRFARTLAITTPTYAPSASALMALALPPSAPQTPPRRRASQRRQRRGPRWDIT